MCTRLSPKCSETASWSPLALTSGSTRSGGITLASVVPAELVAAASSALTARSWTTRSIGLAGSIARSTTTRGPAVTSTTRWSGVAAGTTTNR